LRNFARIFDCQTLNIHDCILRIGMIAAAWHP